MTVIWRETSTPPIFSLRPTRGLTMLDWLAGRLHVTPTVAGILIGLIVVQLAVQLYALADLVRRPRVRGDRKWLWALLIVVGNLLGAIIYLAIGRPTEGVDFPAGGSAASTAGGEAARRAVDALYGSSDKRDGRSL